MRHCFEKEKHVWPVFPSRELRALDGLEDMYQDGRGDIRDPRYRECAPAIWVQILPQEVDGKSLLINKGEVFTAVYNIDRCKM